MEEIKTIDDVLKMDIASALKEQLQKAYITTHKLFGYTYDDCNELTDDRLKYKIAYNLYLLSQRVEQEKQKYLNKAYEFNNSISGEFDGVNISYLNLDVRCNLIKKFIGLGGQENLDKAYKVLQQVLGNSEGIDIDKLIEYTNKLLIKYKEPNLEKNQDKIKFLEEEVQSINKNVVNTPVILEEESRKLSLAEEDLSKILEKQGQQTQPKRSRSAPI